jgi:hypothetical protein
VAAADELEMLKADLPTRPVVLWMEANAKEYAAS